MILYFADRRFNILDHASTFLPEGLVIAEDKKHEEVETGVATFECKVMFDAETRDRVKACTKVGNFLLRSHNDENEYFTITHTEWDEKNCEVYIYAEDAGLDLLNEICRAYTATEAQPISFYVEKFAYDSGFVIGVNEIPSLKRLLSWDSDETVTARLASVATQFDNAEISYSFEVKGLKVVKKYINIHQKRGQDNDVQLRLNKEIDNIIVTESIDNVATALRVTGGVPEEAENPITLDGVVYDDGDIFLEGTYLKSRKAHSVWSRYLAEQGTYTGHICKKFEYDTTSQTELLNRAISELKKIREVEVNYEIDITSLPDNVKIGDRVNVIDDNNELYVSARILVLETSVCDGTQKATIGEYLIKNSGISEKVEELASRFAIEAVEIKKAHQEALEAQKKAEEAKQSADNAQSAVGNVEKDVETLDSKLTASQEAIELANQAAQEAKVNAYEAITQATLSLNASSEAKTQAASAQTKAEQAISDATGASDIAQAAKLDAAQAMEDLAGFEGALNTLESTMEADYARKTELTEVQSSMQSQITQNASQIETTVSRMDAIDETVNSANTKAESAQKAASDAQALADQAKTNASTAQAKADEANSKAQQAASDLAAAEQNLVNVTNRVGATEEEIAQAQSEVERAKETAEAAQTEAINANATASEAKQVADAAKEAADEAKEAVNALSSRVTYAETSITNNAEQIALRATKTEVTETLGGYYTKEEADAAIEVSAKNITSTVSSTYATKSDLDSKAGDYTILIYNGTGGNPKPVRFASVNYSTCNSENGVAVKIGMVSGHGNGTSYAFLQDVILRVNYNGGVEVDNTKQYGAETPTYDGEVRHYGDVFAVLDTTNKIVDFYCLMGQYARVYMTPWKRLTYSSGGTVTQYTSCTVYSSGTKVWANNSDVALQNDVDELTTRVKTAETKIEQTENKITSQASVIEGHETRISTVEQTANGFSIRLDTVEADAIVSTQEQFYQSTSATSLSGGSWSATQPTWAQGKYIWRRTLVTYGDGTTTYTPSSNGVCITGNTGAAGANGTNGTNGTNGSDGRGVKSTSITYQASTNGTTAPTGTWTTSIPSVSAGSFLWTRTIITYTDNTTSTSYSVGKMGNTGAQGAKGDKGDTGATGAKGADGQMLYATCSTAAGTAAKVATLLSGSLSLVSGATVSVKFTNANNVSSPTLNVASTGAKTIRLNGAAITSSLYYWVAGAVVTFVYDGSYWNVSDGSALSKAATAQSTADTANTNAANAAKTATNFMSYDSTNGLLVGNKSSGSWSGYRTQVKSDSFNILDANGNELASYGANYIDLGKNNEDTVIKLCGDKARIQMDSDRYFAQIKGLILQMVSGEGETLSDSEGNSFESIGAVDMFPAGVRGNRKVRLYCYDNYGDGSTNTAGSWIDLSSSGMTLETFTGNYENYAGMTFGNSGRLDIEADQFVQIKTPLLTHLGLLNASDGISIDGKKIVDFVVEQGTSGNWKYKKWNSGTCELWCSVAISNLACATALGAMYRTAEVSTPAFPFTVLEPNVVSSYESPGYGALLWGTGTNTTTTDPTNYYLVRPTSTTIVSGTINLQVKGKWK